VTDIKLLSSEHISEVENRRFVNKVQVKVVDNKGVGVANKLVFGIVSGDSVDYSYPYLYRPKPIGAIIKRLMNFMPGKYNSSVTQLTEGIEFEPVLTDANGEVTFDSLQFRAEGAIGMFYISFLCDGYRGASRLQVTVASSVNKLEIIL
jgi:hypothetical protein